MELSEKKKAVIIVAALAVIGLLSLFLISGYASSEESFPSTYAALDQKRTTVTELMGVTAASSAAISLLPGDAGTPIAEQLADLSGYFMFILGAICLEKWMVTITGMLAFKILIPAACLILILAHLFFGETWKSVGIKLICFALLMFAIVPASVVVTEKIDASYEASMQQMIEDTRNDTEQIQAAAEKEDSNALEKLVNKVKGGVSGQLDKFENTLNRLTESIEVLIVTSCVIPIAVIVFFIWLIKLLTGVSIQIPNMRISKMAWRKRPGLE